MAARVLIADDDADIASAIEVNLELEGYRVHVAHDGIEAVDLARAVRPHVVLLDVVMPGFDGHEVLQALREDPRTRECRVIFVTAKSSTPDETFGRASGAVDYIVKPFAPADLLARVRAVVPAAPSD